MLTVDDPIHIAKIDITTGGSGTAQIINIKNELANYLRIIEEGPYIVSIAANVPSGLIGKFTNTSQGITCETKRDICSIFSICQDIGNKYLATVRLYKWDNTQLP